MSGRHFVGGGCSHNDSKSLVQQCHQVLRPRGEGDRRRAGVSHPWPFTKVIGLSDVTLIFSYTVICSPLLLTADSDEARIRNRVALAAARTRASDASASANPTEGSTPASVRAARRRNGAAAAGAVSAHPGAGAGAAAKLAARPSMVGEKPAGSLLQRMKYCWDWMGGLADLVGDYIDEGKT